MATEPNNPEVEAGSASPEPEPVPTETSGEPEATEPEASEPEATEPEASAPEADVEVAPAAAPPAPAVDDSKKWYVVKVQSGREESIKDAIERRVKIEGLQEFFGQIIIPVERVTEMKSNKRVIKEKKLYPGYLMVNLEFNDRMLYLFRETSGVGDFVGGGLNKPPLPMMAKEVERILDLDKEIKEGPAKMKFDKGDRVRVKDGMFTGMEGEVKEVNVEKGALRVELTIFGRPVPVELEHWQVDYP